MTTLESPKMLTRTTAGRERGFTILEMVIAIMITLIIMGAVYGLLAQGQNAFRREPEISDRQQQIRIAMDLIQRDIVTAGMSLPGFVQAFTIGLDADGPPNAQGVNSDFLELTGYDGACTPVALCPAVPPATPVQIADPIPACYRLQTPCLGISCPLVAIRPGTGGEAASIHVATSAAPGGACGGSTVTIDPPIKTIPLPLVGLGSNDLKPIQIVRYEIAVDAAGIPSLWRSARGGLDAAPAYVPAPNAGSDWQLVASGIEDLQVEYRTGQGLPIPPGWQNGDALTAIPPGPGGADYDKIVREVRVTLTARTTGQAILQGESFSVTGVRAIRGSLTTVTAPRAALFALSVGPPQPPAPFSEQLWQ